MATTRETIALEWAEVDAETTRIAGLFTDIFARLLNETITPAEAEAEARPVIDRLKAIVVPEPTNP